MRDYIGELRDLGYTWQRIADESGLSSRTLRRIQSGAAKLQSGTARYETIRNTSRRLAYQSAKAAGVSTRKAGDLRRALPSPKPRDFGSVREVIYKKQAIQYQMRLLALFRHKVTKRKRVREGFSFVHSDIEDDTKETMQQEAIMHVRGTAEDSNWELIKVIEREIIEYRLG
jgi:predicted transcriptional regulator